MTAEIEKAMPLETGRLSEAQLMLGRAFQDEPLMNHYLRQHRDRPSAINWFQAKIALFGHLYGRAYVTAGPVKGVAIWMPSDGPGQGFWPMVRSGLLAIPFKFGLPAMRRVAQSMQVMDAAKRQALGTDAFWHLMSIGIDPLHQGQGVGGVLLEAGLAQALAAGAPCYLETWRESGRDFFARHGFEVVAEADLPDNGPHLFGMRWQP